jgi:group I intron endonuclease
MKCYIYFIINNITSQRYVGQTTNFARRKAEHLLKLKENRHPNIKLQNAYNKYGLDNFTIQKIQFDNITKEELNEQEIYYIKKYNSFEDGYNLTKGGTGGDTKSKLNFDEYCFAYFGNLKYKGMTNRTGNFLGVDSSCISAIVRGKSYDKFREKAESLSCKEKERYIKDFEEKLDVIKNKPWTVKKTLDDETTFYIMCVVSTYGRGIEQTILKKFELSKGFIFHLMTGNGRMEIKERYSKLSQEEIEKIGEKYFEEWELQNYSKIKIKKEYTDLSKKYLC